MLWKVGKILQTCLAFERKGKIGWLVELVTISPCHGEGHGFESRTIRWLVLYGYRKYK